ncbi:hypothetical protein [Paraburkholderia sacchari]|uniref:hypothetical protein n=1 Tax=Paraburkholderia sacchari TaxID=159450 RepID=UPI001BCB1EF2|nr:hypothetical protein [Paraburkholderia sacchari]
MRIEGRRIARQIIDDGHQLVDVGVAELVPPRKRFVDRSREIHAQHGIVLDPLRKLANDRGRRRARAAACSSCGIQLPRRRFVFVVLMADSPPACFNPDAEQQQRCHAGA